MPGFASSCGGVRTITANIADWQEKEVLAFHVEHVISRQHGGADAADNLALACHHCNLHKGPNLAGLESQTGQLTRLFHPRSDKWEEHFVERESEVIGLTAIACATVRC